jgi:PUA-domain protein
MKKTRLRSKDANKELAQYKIALSKKDQVELVEDDSTKNRDNNDKKDQKSINKNNKTDIKNKLILINQLPSFFYYNDKPVPTLKYLQANLILKKITVDMGAIKFVINGADIMRPGIKEIEEGIEKEELVVIIDENNQKPLAVGISLLSSTEMQKTTSGKVIKNIHYVGDELWKKNL